MCLLPFAHMKITVHGSRDEEIWPQLVLLMTSLLPPALWVLKL